MDTSTLKIVKEGRIDGSGGLSPPIVFEDNSFGIVADR